MQFQNPTLICARFVPSQKLTRHYSSAVYFKPLAKYEGEKKKRDLTCIVCIRSQLDDSDE
jgi:hypothetical protein